ncbi:MAG: hypothetical protein Pg6A_11800 [Termitinemataceae bacterium]|nr:MAG: hypothetical protein Pg6A_11800 [Termitinemataceae bacterium]
MKGVIWKIEGRKSIVLFQNGDFRAIPTPVDAQIGMAVSVSYNKKRIFLFASALCAVAIAAVSAAALYFSPAGYIDIIYERADDRRIIVEFSINRFDRILETRIFSAEAAFSESLPALKHKDVDEGYADTFKAASLLPAASRLRLQITHMDIQRAEELKARFIHLTGELETMTGRTLPLTFEIERLH